MLKLNQLKRGAWLLMAVALLFTVSCEDDDGDNGTNPDPVNNVPTAQGEIQDLLGHAEEYVAVAETLSWNLEGSTTIFTDQDNDNLTYTSSSSDEAVLTTSVTGTELSVMGQSAGTAEITVEASDGDTTAAVSYDFTVIDEKLTGDVLQDTTWAADKEYIMTGQVFVLNGVTLTIEAGTTIKALQNDPTGKAPALIIKKGGRIEADGTVNEPITFTSALPEDQLPQRGTWGGLIILGDAPVNIGEGFVEGIVGEPYGGDDPHDDSGILRYVRVWYGGRSIGQDNEINGVSFAGVGDGTVVEHIEVAYNLDDGFEWWGGTVNAKYLSSVYVGDDDFDTDLGYQGKAQYLFSIKGQEAAGRGFEMDNYGSDHDLSPRSHPQFHNVTLIGPGGGSPEGDGTDQMLRLREGTGGDFRNILVAYGNGIGVRVTEQATIDIATDTEPSSVDELYWSDNNILFDLAGDNFDPDADLPWDAQNVDPEFTNVPATREGTAGIDPTPTNNAVLTGGETLPDDGFFDSNPGFIGAFGGTNWLDGWSILSP